MWKFMLLLALFHSACADPLPAVWDLDYFESFAGYGYKDTASDISTTAGSEMAEADDVEPNTFSTAIITTTIPAGPAVPESCEDEHLDKTTEKRATTTEKPQPGVDKSQPEVEKPEPEISKPVVAKPKYEFVENPIPKPVIKKRRGMFKATHEWQVIKAGQSVRAGLDIRYNIKTQVAEGRIFVDDDLFPSERSGRFVIYDPEDPHDIYYVQPPKTEKPPPNNEGKTDEEIYQENVENLRILMDKHKKSRTTKDTIEALQEIEDELVLDYRLANHFVQKGGYDTVILANFQKDDPQVISETLQFLTLVCAISGNCRIKAYQHGTTKLLAKFVGVNNKQYLEHKVQVRALIAIASLLRNFPQAQQVFLDHEGVPTLLTAMEATDAKYLELNLGAIGVVDNLLMERRAVLNNDQLDDRAKGYYRRLRIDMKLEGTSYCSQMGRAFVELMALHEDWMSDIVEKYLNALLNIRRLCAATWRDNKQIAEFLSRVAREEKYAPIIKKIDDLKLLMAQSTYKHIEL